MNAEVAKFVVRNYHPVQIGEACPDHIWPVPSDQIKRADSIWPSWVEPMWILPGTRGLPQLSVNIIGPAQCDPPLLSPKHSAQQE